MSKLTDRFGYERVNQAMEVVHAIVGQPDSSMLRRLTLQPGEVGYVAGRMSVLEDIVRANRDEIEELALTADTLGQAFRDGGFSGRSG